MLRELSRAWKASSTNFTILSSSSCEEIERGNALSMVLVANSSDSIHRFGCAVQDSDEVPAAGAPFKLTLGLFVCHI